MLRQRPLRNALITLVAVGALVVGVAQARQVRAVGSSTVFPFTSAVAEQFGAKTRFGTPIVEATGTGGGIKLFCSGIGTEFPDVASASRRMKGSEYDTCQANNVREIVELEIGFDGIVIANAKQGPVLNMTRRQLFLAVAAQVPVGNRLVRNPNVRWSDIDPRLPSVKIEVFGPPPTSGTRDSFVELGMEGGAHQFPLLDEMSRTDNARFLQVARRVREDGAWIDGGENDTALVQALARNRNAVGVFGYSFLLENSDRIKAAKIDGIAPDLDTIAEGDYPIARTMFIYFKRQHLGVIAGLAEFAREYASEDAMGEDGYLSERGLIPLLEDQRRVVRNVARDMTPMATRPN
jgi:phosphate transport system substrate-binding protein